MSNLWQSNPAYREQVAAERADERRRVIEELAVNENPIELRYSFEELERIIRRGVIEELAKEADHLLKTTKTFVLCEEIKHSDCHYDFTQQQVGDWLRAHQEEEG